MGESKKSGAKPITAEEATAALEIVRQYRRGTDAITENARQSALAVIRRFISQKAATTSQKAAKAEEDTNRLKTKKTRV